MPLFCPCLATVLVHPKYTDEQCIKQNTDHLPVSMVEKYRGGSTRCQPNLLLKRLFSQGGKHKHTSTENPEPNTSVKKRSKTPFVTYLDGIFWVTISVRLVKVFRFWLLSVEETPKGRDA